MSKAGSILKPLKCPPSHIHIPTHPRPRAHSHRHTYPHAPTHTHSMRAQDLVQQQPEQSSWGKSLLQGVAPQDIDAEMVGLAAA